MSKLPDYLGRTVAIVAEHCGGSEAAAMLAAAQERADAQPSRSLPAARCWPGTHYEDVWAELWRALAARHPDLFGTELRSLGAEPHGATLAWLYLRVRHPDQLLPGLHDDPEEATVESELLHARLDQLRTLGVELPNVHTRYWRVRSRSLLDTYLQSNLWLGISLFCEPATRAHVFLAEPPDRLDEDYARLILHECLHHAITALACPAKPCG